MTDLWDYLKTAEKPIVLYGTGDGADKILDILERRSVAVSDIFASDGFVRHRIFRGFEILSYSEIEKKHDDFIILVAFGSNKPDVMEYVFALAAKHELYIPDVPAYGSNLFDSLFYNENKSAIDDARALLFDNESKELYDCMINFKLTGKPEYLTKHLSAAEEAYTEILHPAKYKNVFDLGAYNGDTVLQLSKYVTEECRITAAEPNPKTFAKLCFNTSRLKNVSPLMVAAWDKKDVLTFNTGRGRGASLSRRNKPKTAEVCADTLDCLSGGEKVDYIKYDVEGAEYEALTGSAGTIKRYSPELSVSVYHRSEDIFKLIIKLKSINPSYRFYLRRQPCIPAWEINLYAIPAEF